MKDNMIMASGYFDPDDCDIEAFKALIARETSADMCPHAADIQSKIPIYDMASLRPDLEADENRRTLMSEWAQVLLSGPGAVVLKRAYADTGVLDEATEIFNTIIAEEKARAGGGADHFAAAGANDRIWNVQEKLCLRAPDLFVRYFANTTLDAVLKCTPMDLEAVMTTPIRHCDFGLRSIYRDGTWNDLRIVAAHRLAKQIVESNPLLVAVGREGFSSWARRHTFNLPLERRRLAAKIVEFCEEVGIEC